jgi:hypothetical protein
MHIQTVYSIADNGRMVDDHCLHYLFRGVRVRVMNFSGGLELGLWGFSGGL